MGIKLKDKLGWNKILGCVFTKEVKFRGVK